MTVERFTRVLVGWALVALVVAGVVLAAWFLIVASVPARAHDLWINHGGYRAPTGESCCGKNDCFVVPDADVSPTSTGWLIHSLDETIPYSETLRSEDKNFWRCKRYDGSRRCFFSPDMGS